MELYDVSCFIVVESILMELSYSRILKDGYPVANEIRV